MKVWAWVRSVGTRLGSRVVDGLLSRRRANSSMIPGDVERASRAHGTSRLLEYRASERRLLRRKHAVPGDLFEAAIGSPVEAEHSNLGLPASYPASPRARRTVLEDEAERRSILLAASRELLRIEIRCARQEEDAFGMAVARALRRRCMVPLLAHTRSSSQLRLAPSGLSACRRKSSHVPFASTRCAAPVPKHAWVYWEVALSLDDSSDSEPEAAPSPLVEVYVGVTTAPTPLDHLVGANQGEAALSSLGGLLVDSAWTSLDTDDDHDVRTGLFGPGDTVGVLAFHHDTSCLLRFCIDQHTVACAVIDVAPSDCVYPTLTLRSRSLHATCAFTARDLRYRPDDTSVAAILPNDEPPPAIYAVDGTRLVRRGAALTSATTTPTSFRSLTPPPIVASPKNVRKPPRSAPPFAAASPSPSPCRLGETLKKIC